MSAGTLHPATGAKRRYYIFPYDWRQDNVVTAGKLDALIEGIFAVTMVSHV